MASLDTTSRFPDPDAAYRAIIEAHRGLSDADSAALNAALVLILANQAGDMEALGEALALARRSVLGNASDGPSP
jgi:anthranilate phosphoribosyltransferase